MVKTRVTPFEYQIFKQLAACPIDWSTQKLLIAFSGGRDSTAMLNILVNLKSRLKFELGLIHVHHGASSDKKVAKYRKDAVKKVRDLAKTHALEFFLIEHKGAALKSEAEFRKFREAEFSTCRDQNGFDFVVYAHHKNDLLETRLIRLIRGTGGQGLRSMSFISGKKLRPLLECDVAQIEGYAVQQKLNWLEDPSNSEDDYFRNWIRNIWLPQLETKRAGSILALARSLENVADGLETSKSYENSQSRPEVIARKEFAGLSIPKKREVLARMMLEQGARDFSRRQIDEILKRLSSHKRQNQRKMSFEIGGLLWEINAEQIEAVRLQ